MGVTVRALDDPGRIDGDLVVAIGSFDGVNRLQRAVLRDLRAHADCRQARLGVVLIDGGVHVRGKVLTRLDQRLRLVADTGLVDVIWTVPETAQQDPRSLVAGVFESLHPACAGFYLRSVPNTPSPFDEMAFTQLAHVHGIVPLSANLTEPRYAEFAELYATRTIVEKLSEGQVAVAARLLGRFYEMGGRVEQGDQRGRLLGFPTANLAVSSGQQLPAEGVYAGVVIREGGERRPAAISLGRRSTFYEAGWELLEAHLLDFDGDLYGEDIRVVFTERVRGQQVFPSADALVTQLRLDVALVRELAPLDAFELSLSWSD